MADSSRLRFSMPKQLIRRYLPDPDRIIQHPLLRFMSKRLADPNLWHLNRHSAARAAFWGLWCAMLPMPFQMLPAAAAAIIFRSNLPLTIVLVWSSNPFTLIPLAWLAYYIGSLLLGMPMLNGSELGNLLNDLSTVLSHWFSSGSEAASARLSAHTRPFLLGAIVMGFLFGCAGYLLMRLFWRWHVITAWNRRREKRKAEKRS